MMSRIFTIIRTVGAKVDARTDRYADERVGNRAANIVAPGGARLKHGVPVIGTIILVVYACFWIYSWFN